MTGASENAVNDSPENETIVAETLYLLMTNEHRISKHLKTQWYLDHVGKTVKFPSDTPCKTGHPRLVSVLDTTGCSIQRDESNPASVTINSNSTVVFLSLHHSLVFAFDVSYSAISSSTADTEVLLDKMYRSFKHAMIGLTKPFVVPGTEDFSVEPYLYVTVIAYSPIRNCPVQQVLTHGYLVTHHNVVSFIDDISKQLNKFENHVATYMNSLIQQKVASRRNSSISSPNFPTFYVNEFTEDFSGQVNRTLKSVHLPPEHGFFHLLKSAMLAINLLPTNCSAGIIVVTDGNVGIGDVGRYDNLLIQFLSRSCTCSIIEVQSDSDTYKRGLGRVPHSEMLQFIATATFGAYFANTPDMESDSSKKINVYHEGILCWHFKKSINPLNPSTPIKPQPETLNDRLTKRIKHETYTLHTPINCFIISRLKEGFTFKYVDVSQKGHIHIEMVIPWRKNVTLEYHTSSQWPVPTGNARTVIEIYYSGSYSFLHDVLSYDKKTNSQVRSTRYRQTVVERFLRSLYSLKVSDNCLVTMQSFHTKDHTIPESIKNGKVALFDVSHPDENPQLVTKPDLGNDIKTIAGYWKYILCMDLGVPMDKFGPAYERSTAAFEKWFHITRLHLLLCHDLECSESLHVPNHNGRFHSVQCQRSFIILSRKMTEWCDFILLEHSHYVKYIHRKQDDMTPVSGFQHVNWQSYCMIMLNVNGGIISLRLTFLGGTDSIYRGRFLAELKSELSDLKIEFRTQPHSNGSDTHTTTVYDAPCCSLFTKPLDRVLIRYERLPRNLLSVDNISVDICSKPVSQLSRLSNYLHHQRWVWSLHAAGFDPLNMNTAGFILQCLTRVRLSEGFHYAQTNSGIVSMILEVDMKTNEDTHGLEQGEKLSLLVQFITFPPQKIKNSLSTCESEGEEDVIDSSGELVLITEVWVEPQHGIVSTPQIKNGLNNYTGVSFNDWPERTLAIDEKFISLQLSFEHLVKRCTLTVSRLSETSGSQLSQSIASTADLRPDPPEQPMTSGDNQPNRVKQIPFNFSAIDLLPLCQQAEVLFYLFKLDSSSLSTHSRDAVFDIEYTESSTHEQYNRLQSPTESNELLFNILMATLEKDKYTNFELTQQESLKFIQQVHARERPDDQPDVPFCVPSCDMTLEVNDHLSESLPACNRLSGAGTSNNTPTNLNLIRLNNLTPASVDSKIGRSHSDLSPLYKQHSDEREDNSLNQIPNFKCFVNVQINGDSASHDGCEVNLIILPATYSDLEILIKNQPTQSEHVNYASDDSQTREQNGVDMTSPPLVPPLNLNGQPENTAPILPIYVYNCTKEEFYSRLMNKNKEQFEKEDQFIDCELGKSPSSGRDSDYNEDLDFGKKRKRTVSGPSNNRFERTYSVTDHDDKSPIGKSSRKIIEIFFRSFVSGLFSSIQKGYHIDKDDVENSLLSLYVCEELNPIEIPITEFIKHTCAHLKQDALPEVFGEMSGETPVTPTTPKSVTFAQPDELELRNKPRKTSSSSESLKPSNLKSTSRILISELTDQSMCSSKLIGRIQKQFLDVIGEWFKPIPSCPDYFYYVPKPQSKQESSTVTDTKIFSEKEIENSSPHSYCDDLTSITPLFLALYATSHENCLSVRSLPVCLSELRDCFDAESIDISSLKVSLDLMCMTLPSYEEFDSTTQSSQSEQALAVEERLDETQCNDVMKCRKEIEWLVIDEITTALRSSPPVTETILINVSHHIKATYEYLLEKCKKKTDGRLNKNNTYCRYITVKLFYVFKNDEKAQTLFQEKFRRMNVSGYILNQCGDYYYLSYDKSRLSNSRKRLYISARLDGNIDESRDDTAFQSPVKSFTAQQPRLSGVTSLHQPIARVSSLPEAMVSTTAGVSREVGQWSESAFSRVRTSSKMTRSESSSGDSIQAVEDSEYPSEHSAHSAIPIPRPSSNPSLTPAKQQLDSLPKYNYVNAWQSEGDELNSNFGSLPKALSSSNVNMDVHDEHSLRARHFSEDTRIKRAKFADGVISPRSNTNYHQYITAEHNEQIEESHSRHTSGRRTPGASTNPDSTGSGYDPDNSDEDATTGGISHLENDHISSVSMPNFWLIMKLHTDKVEIFDHCCEVSGKERQFTGSLSGSIKRNQLCDHLVNEIQSAARLVNQKLLLEDLYLKRRCDNLLEEDENWGESGRTDRTTNPVNDPDSDEKDVNSDEEYHTEARSQFAHGHFKCDCQWSHTFNLHPRLKTSNTPKNMSRGYMALKNVMSNFSINNRNNMFVHRDNVNQSNIFYLRLSEHNEPSATPRPHDSVDTSRLTPQERPLSAIERTERSLSAVDRSLMSRSPSIKSLTKYPDGAENSSRRPSLGETDDLQSISSRFSSFSTRRQCCDDGVKLSVHGVDQVGDDIKVELIKTLQSRLDKNVLYEIESVLQRNPNCLLTPHDVNFIQKRQLPDRAVYFTLPDDTLLYQEAVLHYLRQNLLLHDSIFRPKFQETPADSDVKCPFRDYTEGIEGADYMYSINTFLMNTKSQRTKNSGLSLIYLQLIDSTGRIKHLLDCPTPNIDDWKNFNQRDFERLTAVEKVDNTTFSNDQLSTSSFIRFSIWSWGEVEHMDSLLERSVKHALCDMVCEYKALIAPLSDLPNETYNPIDSLSLPPTSHVWREGAITPNKSHTAVSRSKSSAFSFTDESIRAARSLTHNEPSLSAGPFTDSRRTPFTPRTPYDEPSNKSERGQLLPFYTSTLVDWLEYCHQQCLSSLSRVSCGVLNDCIADPIMKEFESVLRDLPDVYIQPYKLVDNTYVPYQTSSAPLPANYNPTAPPSPADNFSLPRSRCQSINHKETDVEDGSDYRYLNFTYSELSRGHVLIVRNHKLWCDSVQQEHINTTREQPPTSATPRLKSTMKFAVESSFLETSTDRTHQNADRSFPRQLFLMLLIQKGEVIFYSYNLADKEDQIQKKIRESVMNITRWNNTRFHLLNCIAQQKMGLFNHTSFDKTPHEKLFKETNAYSNYRDIRDIEKLSQQTKPIPQDQPSKNKDVRGLTHRGVRSSGSHSNKQQAQKSNSEFDKLDRVYLNCKPTRPIHLSREGRVRDPIKRHAHQLFEILKNAERDDAVQGKLEEIYTNWQLRKRDTPEIDEVDLELLKRSSRLVHHVATPLLLSPHWRDRALNLPKTITEIQHRNETGRSHHDSASSTQGFKLSGAHDSSISHHQHNQPYQEEMWHEEMRVNFVKDYINYLKQPQQPLDQLGFTELKVKRTHNNRSSGIHSRKHSSGGAQTEQLVRVRTIHTVQKTMPGGIFLLELSFQQVYFVVKLYVFPATTLNTLNVTIKKDIPYFVSMCDRMRDYTHCHSFAHDFHLRVVHKFISQSKDTQSKYHIVNMLKDFSRYYEEPPLYSRNALYNDVFLREGTNNPCDRLYKHILANHQHESVNMRKILMNNQNTSLPTSINLGTSERICEFALAYSLPITKDRPGYKLGRYELSVIISHDHPANVMSVLFGRLNLAYFVILSSDISRPHKSLQEIVSTEQIAENIELSSKKSTQKQIETFRTRWKTGPQAIDGSLEKTSILDIQQLYGSRGKEWLKISPSRRLLTEHCLAIRSDLEEMVDKASYQCRRDLLWEQMTSIKPQRRRHMSDYPLQNKLAELNYEEFIELLDGTCTVSLSWYDIELAMYESFSCNWYKKLNTLLQSRYNDLVKLYKSSNNQLYCVYLLESDSEQEVKAVILIDCCNESIHSKKIMLMFKDDREPDIPTPELCYKIEEFINTLCFHTWSQMTQLR